MEKGNIVTGVITGIKTYGLFVKINESTDAFCHISNLSHDFIKIFECYRIGDSITGKVLDKDESGRINISVKDLIPENKKSKPEITKPKLSFDELMKNYIRQSNDKFDSISRRNKKHSK